MIYTKHFQQILVMSYFLNLQRMEKTYNNIFFGAQDLHILGKLLFSGALQNIKYMINVCHVSLIRMNINMFNMPHLQGFDAAMPIWYSHYNANYLKCCSFKTHKETRKHVLTTGCCQFVMNCSIFLKVMLVSEQ